MRTRARERFDEIEARGDRPIGAFAMSSDPSTSAVLAAAGHDFVIIDREHGMIDVAAMVGHVRAAELGGAIPLVRVLEPTPGAVQQALDAGAHGIVVPKAEDPAALARLVRATRYEPGGRGKCPQAPGAGFDGGRWQERAAGHNAQVVLVALIETMAGVEAAPAIAAVPGVDHLFLGPADLSQDLGLDMYDDRDELVALWRRLVADLAGADVRLGAPAGFGFEAEAAFLTVGSDLGNVRAAAVEGIARWRPTGS